MCRFDPTYLVWSPVVCRVCVTGASASCPRRFRHFLVLVSVRAKLNRHLCTNISYLICVFFLPTLWQYSQLPLPMQDRRGMEGALRGDKGLREEEDLQTMGYFKRALGLARPHWHLFCLGLACLTLSNTANIALPNFQGGILDRYCMFVRGITSRIMTYC